jgi:NAD(P)-dependent dehydrogenase (short-subunit alcohol dehydrogenase family)
VVGKLEGKVLLVAGGGGIGGALAKRYALEGARVALGDLDREAARAIVDEIAEAGGQASALRLDGADEGSVAAAVAHCCDAYGGLDGLHANFASFADNGDADTVLDLPLDAYDETMRVNARGFYLCTRHALPAIIARGGGCILYTSSAGAYRGGRARVAYAMSKAAGHALMRHVASTFGKDGVRANSIAPGTIMHEKWEAELKPEFKEWLLGNAPLKTRFGRPTDIAALSALMMSDEGAYVTGQVISIDGGMTMRA